MGEPVEALSALCNGKVRPGWVCLSECCHGDDGLLRGYGTHSIGKENCYVYPINGTRKVLSRTHRHGIFFFPL